MILLGHPPDHVIPGPPREDGVAFCETCNDWVKPQEDEGFSVQIQAEDDNVGANPGWKVNF